MKNKELIEKLRYYPLDLNVMVQTETRIMPVTDWLQPDDLNNPTAIFISTYDEDMETENLFECLRDFVAWEFFKFNTMNNQGWIAPLLRKIWRVFQ